MARRSAAFDDARRSANRISERSHLPQVLGHARRAGRIMRQNLAVSGLILVVLVPLAGFGILGLAAVVATHELAEVVVT